MSKILLLLPGALVVATAALAEPTKALPSVEITAGNLLEEEEFWPYHVKLIASWESPEAQTLRSPKPGVLVRIEDSGLARIDFAAGGVHAVPLEKTNVLEQANAIREGKQSKPGANLVMAIGPRLIDGNSPAPTVLDLLEINEATSFLCVFADPMSDGFSAIAAALRPFEGRHGLRTILFPLGSYVDADVLKTLHQVEWPIAFVMDNFSELYARSLSSSPKHPLVLFTSREGRLFFEGEWRDETSESLTRAIRKRLGNAGLASLGLDSADETVPETHR